LIATKHLNRKAIIERLAKEQNLAKLTAKLDGKGIGDDSEEDDDSVSWALKHKKVMEQRKLEAKRKEKELEELDEEITREYTAG
jgi:hypothetical protein